jgi:lipid-A-disaccharide synthase
MANPLRLMIVCGEPSGDRLGAQLMAALRSETGGAVELSGVGGEAMAALGFETLFPLEATSVMGIAEILPRIPEILKLIRRTADFAKKTRPDAVVLIDSPEFTQRVAKRIRKVAPDIKLITYVAPQVWAMRPGRAKAMAQYLDLMLALLPFEPPFFEKYGLKCVFVGHPAVERAALMTGAEAFRARRGIAADAKLLLVLPGSRGGEVSRLIADFRAAVGMVAKRVPGLVCVLPVVPHVAEKVRAACADWPCPLHLIEDEGEKFAAFAASDVALAASGTVTTESALSDTPTVVAYKVSRLTAAIVRLLIKVKYATLTNLILDREAMPEFIQANCTPENLAGAVETLLCDPAAAAAQRALLREAMAKMGLGEMSPSLRAARAVLDFVHTA